MITKHNLKSLSLLFIAFTLVFFTSCRSSSSSSSIQKTTLRLSWTIQSQFAGAYWAQEKGFFKREGIDMTILPGGPNINEIQMVGSGAEDFGVSSPVQLVSAREKGIPVVALAIIFQRHPSVFFAKKESGIKEPKDFIGKTVAISYGSDLESIYRAMMKKAGVDTIRVKEYPTKFDLTPFFHGDVDVWSGYDTNETLAAEESGYAINRIFPDEYGIKMAGSTLYTTEAMISRKPEICQKVINAFLDGWQATFQDKESAVAVILNADRRLSRIHEKKILDAVEHLTLTPEIGGKIGWMAANQWKDMVELSKELGLIKEVDDYHKCFDSKFVESYYNKRIKDVLK